MRRPGNIMNFISALQSSQDHVYLGNSVRSWIVAVGAALLVLLVTLVIRRIAVNYYQRLANTKTVELTELPMKVISRTATAFLILVSMAVGISMLDTSEKVQRVSHVILTIAIFWQIGLWASTAVIEWLGVRRIRSSESDK